MKSFRENGASPEKKQPPLKKFKILNTIPPAENLNGSVYAHNPSTHNTSVNTHNTNFQNTLLANTNTQSSFAALGFTQPILPVTRFEVNQMPLPQSNFKNHSLDAAKGAMPTLAQFHIFVRNNRYFDDKHHRWAGALGILTCGKGFTIDWLKNIKPSDLAASIGNLYYTDFLNGKKTNQLSIALAARIQIDDLYKAIDECKAQYESQKVGCTIENTIYHIQHFDQKKIAYSFGIDYHALNKRISILFPNINEYKLSTLINDYLKNPTVKILAKHTPITTDSITNDLKTDLAPLQ